MFQEKWRTISRLPKFLNVDTMSMIMNCVILLQNMCVKECQHMEVTNESKEDYEDVIVGAGLH